MNIVLNLFVCIRLLLGGSMCLDHPYSLRLIQIKQKIIECTLQLTGPILDLGSIIFIFVLLALYLIKNLGHYLVLS